MNIFSLKYSNIKLTYKNMGKIENSEIFARTIRSPGDNEK